ncbi:unnamed protein product [Phytomonas sp. Hart1]|nr:unnamed protein product [Phytomonas sp. Hart1]|eukprot:CCW72106.1 unnamed protein product [Phytomonas sp. isolate Hart1]
MRHPFGSTLCSSWQNVHGAQHQIQMQSPTMLPLVLFFFAQIITGKQPSNRAAQHAQTMRAYRTFLVQ